MSRQIEATAAREFAVEVVRKLCAAGYQALWAGGCVRDGLMGRHPTDYDVATSALPEQIREVFGRRRTIAVGAAFGVMTVLGPPRAGQIEVATFRADAPYSDGRHPDRVTFTTAAADAQRRDFTINGLFFDPLTDTVLDYVGGREDLERRLLRAIGNPDERIGEDKLRMLRAVRFATTLGFELEAATYAAICQHKAEIHVVSGERIAEELRKLLVHRDRRRGVELLARSGLLGEILPHAAHLRADPDSAASRPHEVCQATLAVLDHLRDPSFAVALAGLVRAIAQHIGASPLVRELVGAWKLSTAESEGVLLCLARESPLRAARDIPWPQLQRILGSPRIEESLAYAEAVARVLDGQTVHIDYCREKLALPAEQLNPAPLINGDDLKQLGIPPGPLYRDILETIRDEQLSGHVQDRQRACELAEQMWRARVEG